MRKNKLRELLRAGLPSVGTRLEGQWPTMVEVIGHTGMFDYVEIVAEYAPYSLFRWITSGGQSSSLTCLE